LGAHCLNCDNCIAAPATWDATDAARKALLDRAATERMPVVGYHFPFPATGRVERAGTGYRLVPHAA